MNVQREHIKKCCIHVRDKESASLPFHFKSTISRAYDASFELAEARAESDALSRDSRVETFADNVVWRVDTSDFNCCN